MNLHEYQAKQLFSHYHLPILKGVMINSVEQAVLAVSSLNTPSWVVKAQVHAGGRGKAGGVKVVSNKQELTDVAERLLHSRLVTNQTGKQGLPIHELLLEETCDIERELYLSLLVDRTSKKIVFIASEEGGVDIEKVAHEFPYKILKQTVDPFLGVLPYQCRELALKLHFNAVQTKQLISVMENLYKMFVECDLSLIEINPLVITKLGDIVCLDAKINVDDNALYRQNALKELRDTSQEDEKELHASEWELNYISLDGDIGCMVNGAGLAMATLDIIKLAGGHPANFLDVGGGTTEERVKEAFKIILSDAKVKVVLVNILGGIVRCDLIAAGIIHAVSEVGIGVPIVVRLEGNRAEDGIQLLNQSGFNIITANGLQEAAEIAVKKAQGDI